MRIVILIVLAHLAGCESCAFTFGAIEVSGHFTVKGTRPSDLQILECTGPRGDDCSEYPIGDVVDNMYTAYLEPEGVFTCGFSHRWLVVRGTGCTTTAVEALSTDDVDTDIAKGPVTLDLVVRCGA